MARPSLLAASPASPPPPFRAVLATVGAEAQPTNGTTAVGYLRRSTDRQEQSIPDQKKAVESYALLHGLRIDKFYIDDAISGTSSIGRRAFQEMIAAAQRPSRIFTNIIVYDVKRFGRVDNDEAGYYRHVLRMHGVEVCYASENFNGDATDDLLRPVKQWQAREESKDLSRVTIRGLLSKVGGGVWMGGVPPYGYDLRYENAEGKFLLVQRFMPDGTKQVLDENGKLGRTLARGESLSISKRDRAKLVPSEPARVQVIRDVFGMYVEQNKGFKAIADSLNRKKVPTPRGPAWAVIYHGFWTDTTIRSLLVNQAYAGDMVWNRRTDGRFHQIAERQAVQRKVAHGARLVPNAESDWIIIRDAHPALVSRRLFEQARSAREARPTSASQRGQSRKPTGGWNGTRSRFILSGLLQCARCGNRYQGYTRVKGRRRIDGSAVRTFAYACGGYITKGPTICQLNAIPQEELESAVIEAVLTHYRPYLEPGGRERLAKAVRELEGSEKCDLKQARRRLEIRSKEIGAIIRNLLDNITETNRELIDMRLKELQREEAELAAQAGQLETLSISQVSVQTIVAESMQFLAGLERTLRHGVPEEKRVSLRKCITQTRIDFRGGCMVVHVRKLPASPIHVDETDTVSTRLSNPETTGA